MKVQHAGDVVRSRAEYATRRGANLRFLLRKRIGWMQRYITDDTLAVELGCGAGPSSSRARTMAFVADKPIVEIPAGAPPTGLVKEDLVTGSGTEATPGSTVEVHYVGVSWSTKKQFDASWDRGRAFDFPVGAGRVIRGWDEGVAGMRVGGRRRLTIPPDLGYGARGAGGAIGPNETLVFVVDLLAVR